MASSPNVSPPSLLVESSPTLTALVPHLLSARRSLSCVEFISQANLLIRATKHVIEGQAALRARTLYIKQGIRAQQASLERAIKYVTDIRDEVKKEWIDLVKEVNDTKERLDNTVDLLRQTRIEEKLLDTEVDDENLQRTEETSLDSRKQLIDFVDESNLQALLERIGSTGQAVANASSDFEDSIQDLLQNAEKVMSTLHQPSDILFEKNNSMHQTMEVLLAAEQRAGDMMNNLESLVKHFDLCVTVIKHTEGGGVAATKLAQELPGGMDIDLGKDEPIERMDQEELREIMAVIEKDAAEVDDVVADIRLGMEEVQIAAKQIETYNESIHHNFQNTVSIFHFLDDLGSRLPGYITESQMFAYQWEEERSKMTEHLTDLESLRQFYISFAAAYDNLLIEVGRRKDVEKRINKIRRDAMSKIEELIDEEIEERQVFRDQQGDFLPVDIWPGLMIAPSRYEFTKVEDSGDSIPDISASVINRAIKRVSQGKGK